MFALAAKRFAALSVRPVAASSASMFRVSSAFSRSFSEAAAASSRELGTVKWFDSAKGYGFIVRDSGSDLFVHFSAISGEGYRTLEEGQRVEFSVGTGPKGPAASVSPSPLLPMPLSSSSSLCA